MSERTHLVISVIMNMSNSIPFAEQSVPFQTCFFSKQHLISCKNYSPNCLKWFGMKIDGKSMSMHFEITLVLNKRCKSWQPKVMYIV